MKVSSNKLKRIKLNEGSIFIRYYKHYIFLIKFESDNLYFIQITNTVTNYNFNTLHNGTLTSSIEYCYSLT